MQHNRDEQMTEVFTTYEWQARRAQHRQRLADRVNARITRNEKQIKHPVYDFLFEYYSFRPAHLLRWSPGIGVLLQGTTPNETDWPSDFQASADGCILNGASFPQQRRAFIAWAIEYLQAVSQREPLYHCFGLHEWAMVYHEPQRRHARVPLRLSQIATDAVVDSTPIRCTHFDAFRFFTHDAQPLNRNSLTRENAIEFDQPGCVHANMDLYKWAMKITPYLRSDIVAESFEIACEARELDMRASPYDLSEWNFLPIRIETKEGRDEYFREQKSIAVRAAELRAKLLNEYHKLYDAFL